MLSFSMPNSASSLFCRHGTAPVLSHVRDEQHIWTVGIKLKPLRDILTQHRRCEWPEALAIFYFQIEVFLHDWRAGVAQDRTRTERPWTEFHAALEPPHRLLVGKGLCGRIQ